MSESRILIVDADRERGDRIGAILDFMDLTPTVLECAGDLRLKRHTPQDWLAIVVGTVNERDPWNTFASWLADDPMHPPLLVMSDDGKVEPNGLGVNGASVWALDYPIKQTQLNDLLRRASIKRLDDSARAETPRGGPSGSSAAVQRLRRMIEQVAKFDTTVLILGESGSGKEVVARAIFEHSARAKGPFIAMNCGAIPSELMESELFGHEKGAFTGAVSARKGRFELAEGGTLFLDEIGDMSLPMQVKLLRVLQERRFERVGGDTTIQCNVRVIAATHRNLEASIEKGTFREDLYYRLNVFPIEVPSLRERTDDLGELVNVLAHQLAGHGRARIRLSPDALRVLRTYAWPGNVRELSNLVERLSVLHPGQVIEVDDLPVRYRANAGNAAPVNVAAASAPPAGSTGTPAAVLTDAGARAAPPMYAPSVLPPDGLDLKEHIGSIESTLIRAALERADGVVAHAAQLLRLRRTTLVEKLRKYGLGRESLIDEGESDTHVN
ncbi:sigma-54 dependent transcriptional regulator [Tahibacter amnicola]|uniref:Sigma-54 dependent transcriptional regulator n=1 Tax=Tahibacter amnicola TaxID=2976241 RepID=A0ABY6BCM1_9GAMM|nr:sigma-54 dependent transcriptional regulator [Tahibacter amnicola]UXI67321.1 sigma-54 dependent transcriptional regulator [Tahibacter amnicola]